MERRWLEECEEGAPHSIALYSDRTLVGFAGEHAPGRDAECRMQSVAIRAAPECGRAAVVARTASSAGARAARPRVG
jgi:hypothetical protein